MKIMLILMTVAASIGLAITPTPTPTPSPTPLIPTPIPTPTPDISTMVAKLKAAKTANKPFTIFMKDGSSVLVPSNAFIAFNPSGKFTFIVVYSLDDTMESIPVNLIAKLVLVNNYPFDN